MRKTNNLDGYVSDEVRATTFWVVYDEDTEEILTSNSLEAGYTWDKLHDLDSENPGPDLDRIDASARFDSKEEAQDAAEDLLQEIADEHPNDEINLDVLRVEVRHVLRVDIVPGEGGAYLDPSAEAEDDGPADEPLDEDECCSDACDDSCLGAPDHDDVLEGQTKKPKKSKKRR